MGKVILKKSKRLKEKYIYRNICIYIYIKIFIQTKRVFKKKNKQTLSLQFW